MAAFDWFPVWLSLRVALLATTLDLFIGIAVAWFLVRTRSRARNVVGSLFSLPLILPPTVLGYYLLVALGRQSPIGIWLDELGVPFVFSWRGAVVAASVSALPLMVQSARAALEGVDPELENVARTLGRTEFEIAWTVTLPLAWRGLFAGTMLAFARALGDFGTTLMVAGNIPGLTQTLPLAIYDRVQSNDFASANTMVLLITVLALVVLLGSQRLVRSLGL